MHRNRFIGIGYIVLGLTQMRPGLKILFFTPETGTSSTTSAGLTILVSVLVIAMGIDLIFGARFIDFDADFYANKKKVTGLGFFLLAGIQGGTFITELSSLSVNVIDIVWSLGLSFSAVIFVFTAIDFLQGGRYLGRFGGAQRKKE